MTERPRSVYLWCAECRCRVILPYIGVRPTLADAEHGPGGRHPRGTTR